MKTTEQLTQELEAVKMERAWFKDQFDMLRNSYSIMVPQRDEAVRYLKRWLRGENRKQLQSEIEGFLSRLSSGETKVEELNCICSQGGIGFNIHNGIAYCKGCGYKLKETNSSNRQCWTETPLRYCTREEIESGKCKCTIDSKHASNNSSSKQETSRSEKPNSSPCKHLHVSGTVCTDCGEFANCSGFPDSSPESPWISVEEQPPVVGGRYIFINDITHSNYYGEVFGGKYMGCRFGYHEFGLPGYSMTAKYYCPIPAPPESLTDKTK